MPNFNAFMHRRNIFRKEPEFKNLACEYQELKQFMTSSSKNKLKFDFKNPDALRALTCALLHRYFQKRITLPTDRMIPAVPQRLNYICWIEDLVKLLSSHHAADLNVLGIDIGTGASCIFPILSCHRNPNWSFIGVEADAKSYSIAMENVQKNFMDDRIRIVKISIEDTLNDILCLTSSPVTFIMCNPPFFEEEYGVTLEMNPNITGASAGNGGTASGQASSTYTGGRPKSSANSSDKVESVCSGGEIAFVGRLLEESRHLKEEVTIYSSMLGRKQSLTHFKQTLSSLNEDNLSWTWAELCQGKTIRYAIAWSFFPGLDLTRAPPLRHGKNKSWKVKLQRKMPKRDCQLEMLENMSFLKNLISRELMIAKARVTRQTAQNFEILIKTNERTWTHQRRKRREQQLNRHKHQATPSSVNSPTGAGLSSQLGAQGGGAHEMVCESIAPDKSDNTRVSTKAVQPESVAQLLIGSDLVVNEGASQAAAISMDLDPAEPSTTTNNAMDCQSQARGQNQAQSRVNSSMFATACSSPSLANKTVNQDQLGQSQHQHQHPFGGMSGINSFSFINARKRKNPSSCSSSPSRICPSPNDELTDDDNQSTDNSDNIDTQNEDSMNESSLDIKRLCRDNQDDCENMDDIYDYLLCCRISLIRCCHDLYFELKLEHPCTAANDAYDLFQYFRNKFAEK